MPKSARPSAFIQIRQQGFDYSCACGARVFNTPERCRCYMTDEVRSETRREMGVTVSYWRNVAFGWATVAIALGAMLLGVWLR